MTPREIAALDQLAAATRDAGRAIVTMSAAARRAAESLREVRDRIAEGQA